jgi:hypothetical protein
LEATHSAALVVRRTLRGDNGARDEASKADRYDRSIKAMKGSEGVSVAFERLPFPRTKEEVEAVIVSGFLRSAQSRQLLPPTARAIQNCQDDFDFTLTGCGNGKHLELMEIAPLEHLRGTYDEAPTSYRPYDFAAYILEKLKGKSARYASSAGDALFLLMYVTDWRFTLSETVIALLQFWTASRQHSFGSIYCYSPISEGEGIVHLIHPTPAEFWAGFDPERYRENVVHNLNPLDWKPA